MTAWATPDQLRVLGEDLGVHVPQDDDEAERLLARAQDGCEVWGLRARMDDLSDLDDAQLTALANAACRQALWLVELDPDYLGPDNLVAAEDLTFSRDPRPRLAPAALDALALYGLIARTGTVEPDPAPGA